MVSSKLDKTITVRLKRSRKVWIIYSVAASIGIVILPLLLGQFGYDLTQSVLAILLLCVCAYPTARYFANSETGVPVFAVLCLSYGFQFALPIFINEASMHLIDGVEYLSTEDVNAALLLSVLGTGALQVGYYSLRAQLFAKVIPSIDLHLDEKRAVIYCITIGVLFPLLMKLTSALPEQVFTQASAIITLLLNQVLVAIGIMGWIVYSGRGNKWHKVILYGIVAIATIEGVATGLLEQAILPMAVLFMTEWMYRKRIPYRKIILAVLIFFFLSPVKISYREKYWYDNDTTSVSTAQKTLDLIGSATSYWGDTLSGNQDLTRSTSEALYRTDLIHQFAYIYSQTPSMIPYQYGGTYSYFAVALIPRILWPNKPEAGAANKYYAVSYRITTEEGAKKTSFGMSILAEGFINFGIAGVILVMVLQGVILSLLQKVFAGDRSGPGANAVFIAFFAYFLNGIGSSAEIMFGNIVQFLICSCALLWWARKRRSSVRHFGNLSLPHSTRA